MLVGDASAVRAIAGSLRDLGEPGGKAQKLIARGVGREVRAHLFDQFQKSTDPTGTGWRARKDGKPALVSKKLPGDFRAYPTAGGVAFAGRIKWLRAHHEGHTFPARRASHLLAFDKRGVQVKAFKRLGRGKAGPLQFNRKVYLVQDANFTVGARVLPRRPIYPEGAIPAPWADAINRGAALGWSVWKDSIGA